MTFKNILPYEKYVLTSKLSADEVCKRISENIEHRKGLQFSLFRRSTLKPYEGQILNHSFTINRIIQYKNSFLPLTRGNISTFFGQTQISIEMKLSNIAIIFISIWLAVVGIICLGILIIWLLQIAENKFSPGILIPFGMFIFGCLLTTLSFKFESKKTKVFLANLLEGQENT